MHRFFLYKLRFFIFLYLSFYFSKLSLANDELYSASFKNTDLVEFINIVSKNLEKTIIIEPNLRAQVNVRSYDLLTKDQYYQFFLNVLEVYGFAAVEQSNDVVKVIRSNKAKTSPTPVTDEATSFYDDEFITRVVAVKNVSVRELAPLLRQLNDSAGGGNVVNYDPSNVLMLTGRAAVINRLVAIVEMVDKAGDQEIDIVELEYASSFEIVRIVENLWENQNQRNTQNNFLLPKVVADDRTNSVLVTGEKEVRQRVVKLIKRLDKDLENFGNTKTFYLKYSRAENIVPVLEGIAGGLSQESSGTNTTGSMQNTAYQGASQNEVNIEFHEASNSIVINAQPDIMASLARIIENLDIRRAQVLVEAIIVEVMEGTGAAMGVQWFSDKYGMQQWNTGTQAPVSGLWAAAKEAREEPGSIICDPLGSCTENPATPGDYTLLSSLLGTVNGTMIGVVQDDWAAVLQAVSTSTNSNILATPSITTLDNQEAYFIVGQDVPVLTGTTGSGANVNPFQTIEREEVGVKLTVTPQINEGDAIQMIIEQEVSGISGQTSVDITINKREMKTTVLADDGSTIVLGGLIDEDAQESVSKVPYLSDIPFLGALFTSTSSEMQKRTLMVFMRPSIIRDNVSSNAVSQRKYNFIRAEQLKKREAGLSLLDEDAPLLDEWGRGKRSDEENSHLDEIEKLKNQELDEQK